jgi:hypothetical protein
MAPPLDVRSCTKYPTSCCRNTIGVNASKSLIARKCLAFVLSEPVRCYQGHGSTAQKHQNWGSVWIGCDLALTCAWRFFLVAQQVSFWQNETINHRAGSPGRSRRNSHVRVRVGQRRRRGVRGCSPLTQWRNDRQRRHQRVLERPAGSPHRGSPRSSARRSPRPTRSLVGGNTTRRRRARRNNRRKK